MVAIRRHLQEDIVNTCVTCLRRIEQTKVLNAFITVLKDDALSEAYEAENRFKNGTVKSKIDGLTIAVKDNFCTRNVKTTCASKMLKDFVSPYNATVVERLKNAGAVILGKTNLDEFAMGSGTVDSLFGPTKNIWGSPIKLDYNARNTNDFNQWYIAGGSSGGSAVAVATGAAFAAIGSDTGGSTRNPASYCGVVGFKPTYGTVSRYGLIPLVNSMDVPGILARTVEDVADVYNVISGLDERDSTTVDERLQLAEIEGNFDPRNLTVGIPNEYHCSAISPEILNTWQYVSNILKDAGATVKEISMPHTEYSIVTYSILNQCEVASNMSRYSGLLYGHRAQSAKSADQLIAQSRKEGFGPVVRARILAGNYFLLQRNYEKYFVKAMKVRRLITEDFKNAWMAGIHVLLSPTTLTTAPLLSEFLELDNRTQCSMQDYCTQPVNMAGCPAISLPITTSKNNLPISLQLIGRNFDDSYLLKIAAWLQSIVSFPHLT